MTKYYKSYYYTKSVEVENIDGEIIVSITDKSGRESIYSWYDIKSKKSESIYINKCLLWGFVKKIPKDILIVWCWGWAFIKYLEDYIKDVNITWIEIDEAMVKIAKEEFKIKTNNIYIEDTFNAIKKIEEKKEKFELILIDVYWSNWEIPEYFGEEIFIKKIKKILLKDWIISINFSNHDFKDKKRTQIYDNIHSNLIIQFWEYYSHILSWKNDRWNIAWIYNLDKNYKALDFNKNYLEKVKNWEIVYDCNLIKNTILDQ